MGPGPLKLTPNASQTWTAGGSYIRTQFFSSAYSSKRTSRWDLKSFMWLGRWLAVENPVVIGSTSSTERSFLPRSSHLVTTTSSLFWLKQGTRRYGKRNFSTLRPRWLPRLGGFSVCFLEFLSWLSGTVPSWWRNMVLLWSPFFTSLFWEIEYSIVLIFE